MDLPFNVNLKNKVTSSPYSELLSLIPVVKLKLPLIIGDKTKTIPKIIKDIIFNFNLILSLPK